MTKPGRRTMLFVFAAICVGVVSPFLATAALDATQLQVVAGRRSHQIVITNCVYYGVGSSNVFRTELKGIEVSGSHDVEPNVGVPCSQVISRLSSQGFSIVSSTSAAGDYDNDGVVDTADYVIWRKSS